MIKKGVIFDLNGTLLWDTQLHNTAWDNFLKRYELSLSDEEKNRRIHGRVNSDVLMELFDHKLSADEVESYSIEKELEYQKICLELDDFSLAAGAVQLFEKLESEGIPFVIATGSVIFNVEFYIKTLKLDQWFREEHIIYNDGTLSGKPSPDLFLKALDAMGVEGRNAVIFEDSIAGLEAAEAANAGKIIIVDSGANDYSAYRDKYPIINDFNEVDMNWFKIQ